MTTEAKTIKKKTEMGIVITMPLSHKLGEDLANLKEVHDSMKGRISSLSEELLEQMEVDQLTTFKAKSSTGSLYQFDRVRSMVKIKISQPK